MTVLRTERLALRPMRPDDAEPLMAVFGDPVVMAAFERGPFTDAEMEGWVARNLEHWDAFGYGLFTIVERATGTVIGDCGLERISIDGRDETELGYDLRHDRWGQGLATEAATAVARHAFAALSVDRLVSLVRSGNRRSAAVATRIGMMRERQLTRGDVAYDLYVLDHHAAARG